VSRATAKIPRGAIRRAIDLFVRFREHQPEKIHAVQFELPKAVMVVGHLESVCYRTTHGKKPTLYEHKFAPGSRPLLVASADGKQLLLMGGKYNFTERGIVDYDEAGQEVENPIHGESI
jgi:hypothetical protein